jgi:SAM-dependent methyltransferase
MLARARERAEGLANVEFIQQPLTDLSPLAEQVDVAIAVNSLVMPDVTQLEMSLRQIRSILLPGGLFLGIVPAMDAVHYYTMLLLDRAVEAGKPLEAARKNAAHHNEHALYDFAFGQFRYQGLEQHFWQPFEIPYRLRRAGFRRVRTTRVVLAWDQIACADDLRKHPPPWDWFFSAEPGSRSARNKRNPVKRQVNADSRADHRGDAPENESPRQLSDGGLLKQ